MIGKTIFNWKITDFIGEGGMCKVYKAENEDLKGSFASIKCLKEEHFKKEALRNRFEDEAKKMLKFQERSGSIHKNIVEFKNFKKEENSYYLITEFVDGVSLKDHIQKHQGPSPPEKAVIMFRQILDACQHMHNNNLVHRDLAPDNIMLKPSGRIKILDFGIAKDFWNDEKTIEETQDGHLVGKPKYMSPEQIQGKKINHLSDIYSLGVVFYEMLTGQYCYPDANSLTTLSYKVVHESLPNIQKTLEYLPDVFNKIIAKATEKDPTKRAKDCNELIQLLEDVSNDKPIAVTIQLSNFIMANININGKDEMANKVMVEGNIGTSYPLSISKKGYKKVNTELKISAAHKSNSLVEINLKKKFLGIF
jgi:serine/threonine-protein kinase